MPLDQDSYRWRNDDGSETAATWIVAVNTTNAFDVLSGNADARLRFLIKETGGESGVWPDLTLQFRINGGTWTALGPTSTGCIYFDSSDLTDLDNTTQQVGAGSFIVDNAGIMEEGTGPGGLHLGSDEQEPEYTIRFVASELSDNDVIEFRVQQLNTFTVLAHCTIVKSASNVFNRKLSSSVEVEDIEQIIEKSFRLFLDRLEVNSDLSVEAGIYRLLVDSSVSINIGLFIEGLSSVTIRSSLLLTDPLRSHVNNICSLASTMTVDDSLFRGALLFSFLLDKVSITEDLQRKVFLVRSLIHSIAATDTSASKAYLFRSLAISEVELSDNVYNRIGRTSYLTSLINVSSVEFSSVLINAVLQSSVDAGDSVLSKFQGAILSRVLSSGLEITDKILVALLYNRVLSTHLELSETLVVSERMNRFVQASLAVSDSNNQTLYKMIRVFSNAAIESSSVPKATLHRGLASFFSLVDAIRKEPQEFGRVLFSASDVTESILRTIAPGFLDVIVRSNLGMGDTLYQDYVRGLNIISFIEMVIEVEAIAHNVQSENIDYEIEDGPKQESI